MVKVPLTKCAIRNTRNNYSFMHREILCNIRIKITIIKLGTEGILYNGASLLLNPFLTWS